MHQPSPSFVEVINGLQVNEQTAARKIYERFIDQLIRLAANRLHRPLGADADPEDVAHSVMESFFAGHAEGKFEVHNWSMVYGLLAHITLRKCLNRIRHLTAQKRDVNATSSFADWEYAANGPGPDEEAMVADLLDKVLREFDEDQREVIEAFMQGASKETVAIKVRLSVRTIDRIVERFRGRLMELLSQE